MTIALLTAPSCAPYVQIKSDLVTQSRRGVQLVREVGDARQKLIDEFFTTQRAQLDNAFDLDALARSPLTPDWVVDARKAYALGIDALHRQADASARAHDAAAQNLAEVDRALQQLQLLHELEQRLSIPGVKP